MPATATFQIDSWEEQPVRELDGGSKITRATVVQSYEGEIVGIGTIEYTMFHRPDGTASFQGFEVVEGTVAGRDGRIVLSHFGQFEAGTASSSWRVVVGSGTGGLDGASGSGSYEADHDCVGRVTFDLELG